MTAPNVIWAEPGMPGYTDDPCAIYTVRYIRADAPELVALVDALQWIALGPGYNETPADAVLSNMRQAAAAIEVWEKMTHDATP